MTKWHSLAAWTDITDAQVSEDTSHAGSRGARLLQKMEGAAASTSAGKPGSAPISEGMRVASKARLVQAMRDSPACRDMPSIQQAAEVRQGTWLT